MFLAGEGRVGSVIVDSDPVGRTKGCYLERYMSVQMCP